MGENVNTVKGWIRKEGLTGLRGRGGRKKRNKPGEKSESGETAEREAPSWNANHIGGNAEHIGRNAEHIGRNTEHIGRNTDRHLCKTCKYRCGKYDKAKGVGCDYLCKVGHSRGCKVEDCSVYEKGEPVKRQAFQEETQREVDHELGR